MSLDAVIVARRGTAACLTINRPAQHNALSNEVLAGLRAAVRDAKSDPDVRSVVITGAGDRSFSAGGDLSQMSSSERNLETHEGRSQLAGLFKDMWTLGKPTVARVRGYALAGGCGLAAACDFVAATETSTFGIPEVRLGLWPYMITVPLLHCMPARALLRLMLTGRRFPAAEAARLGIVSDLVADNELDQRVDELVETLAQISPDAVALGRTTFYSVADTMLDLKLQTLQAMLTVSLDMPDAREGLAAFAENRPPSWAAASRQPAP
jgi:enoyl-CoA hydratase/carnithine racemase